MSVRILCGNCLDILPTLVAESVQMCVTSPPYWGLRDYGVAGQIGLEPTPAEYVEKMVAVFREVRRVLRDDGTCWINLGDSYARSVEKGGSGPGNKGNRHIDEARAAMAKNSNGREALPESAREGSSDGEVRRGDRPGTRAIAGGLKPKDLVGIPWRVAFALQADGWYLRQDIIWAKPNPMPESVRDRCTKAHEYLFLLAKSEQYYFDAKAIAEPVVGNADPDAARNRWDREQSDAAVPPGNNPMKRATRTNGKHSEMPKQSAGHRIVENVAKARENGAAHDNPFGTTRNKRSVWTVATQPYKEAHFATFPPALIEPCILAGSRPGDTVLDPFFGSGTVGEVAERFGRKWVGIELNPEYVNLAKRRTAQQGLMYEN